MRKRKRPRKKRRAVFVPERRAPNERSEILESKRGTWSAPVALCVGVALALALQWALLPEGPIWITDNGCKEILLRNFAERGTFALENPAKEIDPEGEFFPGGFHFRKRGDSFQAIYPELFSFVSCPAWLLLGRGGLLLLPALGLLAALAGFLRILSFFRFPSGTAALLGAGLVFGTPLFFYAGTFWETTLAAAFAVWAVDARLRGRDVSSGLLFGLAILFREEACLAALCLGAAFLLFRPKPFRAHVLFAVGVAIPALALGARNLHVYGHVLGFHGAAYQSGFGDPALAYFLYWLRFDAWDPEALWSVRIWLFPIALLPIAGLFRGGRRAKTCLLCLCMVSWAVLYWRLLRNPEIVRFAGWNVGLLSSSPLLAGAFLCARDLLTRGPRALRALTLFALLYCVALPPVLTQADIGVIWGPRHFLPVAPMLLLASFEGIRRLGLLRGRRRAIPAGLFLCALLHSAAGETALFRQARDAEQASRELARATEDVVLTDVFFLPEMTPQLWGRRRFLYVRSDAELPRALEAIRRSGERRFDVVLTPESQYGTLTPRALRWLDGATEADGDPIRCRTSPGSFLNFDVYPTRLRE